MVTINGMTPVPHDHVCDRLMIMHTMQPQMRAKAHQGGRRVPTQKGPNAPARDDPPGPRERSGVVVCVRIDDSRVAGGVRRP